MYVNFYDTGADNPRVDFILKKQAKAKLVFFIISAVDKPVEAYVINCIGLL